MCMSTNTSENKLLTVIFFLPLEGSRDQSQFNLLREASSGSRGILPRRRQGLCISEQKRSQGLFPSSDHSLSLRGGMRRKATGCQISLVE